MGNILFVVQRVLPGGTESHVLSLATALVQRGHKVGLFTSGGPWLKFYRNAGVTIHQVPGFVHSPISVQTTLRNVLRTHSYQVLHLHDSAGLMLLTQRRVPSDVRVIATVHGTYLSPPLLRKADPLVHRFIAVSQAVQKWLVTVGVQASKQEVIPNGVSTIRFSPKQKSSARKSFGIPQAAFVIGYAGRFTLGKHLVSMKVARALRAYQKSNPDVVVLIAGNQSRLAIGRWQSKRYVVLGSYADMPTFYRACDLVVGTGRVALEALSCACPTIAVGESKYIGCLNALQLTSEIASNFGDQGPKANWTEKQLKEDIALVKDNLKANIQQAEESRRAIIKQFSQNTMAASVQKLYKFAKLK